MVTANDANLAGLSSRVVDAHPACSHMCWLMAHDGPAVRWLQGQVAAPTLGQQTAERREQAPLPRTRFVGS
jgi:hypothetical protein